MLWVLATDYSESTMVGAETSQDCIQAASRREPMPRFSAATLCRVVDPANMRDGASRPNSAGVRLRWLRLLAQESAACRPASARLLPFSAAGVSSYVSRAWGQESPLPPPEPRKRCRTLYSTSNWYAIGTHVPDFLPHSRTARTT